MIIEYDGVINMKKEVILTNEHGLHARPASKFVKKTNEFNSDITIVYKDKHINGKSMIEVMGAGLNQDNKITIITEGDDETEAMDEIISFLKNELSES